MVFSDLFFLFAFIPAFIICYLVAGLADKGKDAPTFKNTVLVCFSLIFYAWGEPIYVFLMLVSVLINYKIGIWIDASDHHRKVFLVQGIVCNVLIIGIFKYAGFFATQLNNLGVPCEVPNIALPIGISFYTFQSISYLIDVYRKDAPVQKKYMGLLLYISMFPQLIAGPIVRYGTVAEEINKRSVTAKDISDGITRFMIGLAKKVIIANQLSEIADQMLANGMNSITVGGAWLGIIAFTLQIYFDFSGYSDMAIGIGRCMGFHFNENFNHPYISRTITEFWRRWHMSLGSFFRDYVYIPLGGNRHHQWFNILTVWFLTGMWHGASWNFILWGVYFGIIVLLEKYTILKIQKKIPNFILHIYTIVLFVLGWGIFYFDDFNNMLTFFNAAFGGVEDLVNIQCESAMFEKFWILVVALLFCMPIRHWASLLFEKLFGQGKFTEFIFVSSRLIFAVVVLVVATALLVGATNNAFLYTRF